MSNSCGDYSNKKKTNSTLVNFSLLDGLKKPNLLFPNVIFFNNQRFFSFLIFICHYNIFISEKF